MNADNYCFCELAPLYALDLLSEQERSWVEQQLIECPELAEELAEYQTTAAAIPYSSPAVEMAADLKDRLFDRLGLDSPVTVEEKTPPLPFFSVRSHQVKWRPHSRVAGVSIARLHIDPVKREIVGLLRAEPGVRYPFHRHATGEEIYMLEGDLVIENQVYGAGDYIRSRAGSSHAPHTNGGCMFFLRTSMDDEYPELATVG